MFRNGINFIYFNAYDFLFISQILFKKSRKTISKTIAIIKLRFFKVVSKFFCFLENN